MKPMKVSILGAGSWGTALSTIVNHNGHHTSLWIRSADQAVQMQQERINKKYLPDILIPPRISLENDLEKSLFHAEVVILAVPTQQIRPLLKAAGRFIPEDALLINVAKGIEQGSNYRISEIVGEEIGNRLYAAVSGPSHAEEVALKMPTTLVAASQSKIVAEKAQNLLMNQYLRVYTNPDVIGVELAGALKNVIAFGAGIADGIGHGDNARAALITRGIAEIARLGKEMGASLNTFAGLAGIGDLVVTCTSMHSRNRRAGIMIGQGKNLDETLKAVGMVVEGVLTASAAYELARQYEVDMPITNAIYSVLYEHKHVMEAVQDLMTRDKKHEMEEVAEWQMKQWEN